MNKQVIKLGGVACFAFIIMMSGFAYAFKEQDSNQNTNRGGANRNGNANSGGNTNANTGGMNVNLRDHTDGNLNAVGNMNNGGMTATGGGTGTGGAMLNRADREFMMRAVMSGVKEVELSRLAATRATREDLREFAQRMVEEHTAKNAELMQLAAAKGLTLSGTPDTQLRSMLTRLGALSSAEFDRAYLKEAGVKEHRNAVKLFERASTRAVDADVRSFAAATLPAIRMHLSMAETMSGMHGAGGANHNGGMHGNTGGNSNMNSNMNSNANRSGGGNTNNSGAGNSNQPFRR
ncbi:MAG TPA: DUF4142 domain-containing protein [Pyrinomonadaceae bacterium]